MTDLKNFMDQNGKIIVWASKRESKLLILRFIAAKFEKGRFYTEKEVNRIIDEWHTFGDYFLIRRELIDNRLLARTTDGSRYWLEAASKDEE